MGTNRLFSEPVLNYLTQYTVKRMPKTAQDNNDGNNDQENPIESTWGEYAGGAPSRGWDSLMNSMEQGYIKTARSTENVKDIPSPSEYFDRYFEKTTWPMSPANKEWAKDSFITKLRSDYLYPDQHESSEEQVRQIGHGIKTFGGKDRFFKVLKDVTEKTQERYQDVKDRGFGSKALETLPRWLTLGIAGNVEAASKGRSPGLDEMFAWGDPGKDETQESVEDFRQFVGRAREIGDEDMVDFLRALENPEKDPDPVSYAKGEHREEDKEEKRTPYGETIQEAKNKLRETSSLSPDAKGYGHAKGTTPTTMAFGYGGTAYGGQRRPDMSSNKTMDKLMRAVPGSAREQLWREANQQAGGDSIKAKSLYEQKAKDYVTSKYYGEDKDKEHWNEKWKNLQEKQTGLSEAMAKLQRQRPDEGAWSAQASKTMQRLRERNQELQESMNKAKAGKWLHEQDYDPEEHKVEIESLESTAPKLNKGSSELSSSQTMKKLYSRINKTADAQTDMMQRMKDKSNNANTNNSRRDNAEGVIDYVNPLKEKGLTIPGLGPDPREPGERNQAPTHRIKDTESDTKSDTKSEETKESEGVGKGKTVVAPEGVTTPYQVDGKDPLGPSMKASAYNPFSWNMPGYEGTNSEGLGRRGTVGNWVADKTDIESAKDTEDTGDKDQSSEDTGDNTERKTRAQWTDQGQYVPSSKERRTGISDEHGAWTPQRKKRMKDREINESNLDDKAMGQLRNTYGGEVSDSIKRSMSKLSPQQQQNYADEVKSNKQDNMKRRNVYEKRQAAGGQLSSQSVRDRYYRDTSGFNTEAASKRAQSGFQRGNIKDSRIQDLGTYATNAARRKDGPLNWNTINQSLTNRLESNRKQWGLRSDSKDIGKVRSRVKDWVRNQNAGWLREDKPSSNAPEKGSANVEKKET